MTVDEALWRRRHGYAPTTPGVHAHILTRAHDDAVLALESHGWRGITDVTYSNATQEAP